MREVPESTLSSAKIKTEQELSNQVKEDICDRNQNSPEKKRPKQEDNETAEKEADFFMYYLSKRRNQKFPRQILL